MRVFLDGVDAMAQRLRNMNQDRFTAVSVRNLTELFNRLQTGGTPEDSRELVRSLRLDAEEIGYTKEYGPHVEYGHRTISGGYVPGQYYLRDGVEAQKGRFRQDLLNELRRG